VAAFARAGFGKGRIHSRTPELLPEGATDASNKRARMLANRLSCHGGAVEGEALHVSEDAVAAGREELVEVDAVRAVRLLRQKVAAHLLGQPPGGRSVV